MAAPSSSSPGPSFLMDELVEDCLLRLPPEDPADLARAALVSRQWHRVVTGAVFRRRYVELHRSAPLLGCMINLENSTRFVPTSSFRPPQPQADSGNVVRAVHSKHGRVLLHSAGGEGGDGGLRLLAWDPRKDKQWELPVLQPGKRISNWDAVLFCTVGDGCSHLDCLFKVVFVGRSEGRTCSCFYSSEVDIWSDPIFVADDSRYDTSFHSQEGVFTGNDFCYKMGSTTICKLDMLTHQLCWIGRAFSPSLLIATQNGSILGLAKIITNSALLLLVWQMEQRRWVESRHIQLRGLLPDDALCDEPLVVGFEETGAGVIYLRTCVGYFAIDLNSGRSTKVGNVLGWDRMFPYKSFCTPAPRTVSTNEGPGASVVVSTDGVVVSRDEGLGDVAVFTDEGSGDVAVSTDEGPGPSMSST